MDQLTTNSSSHQTNSTTAELHADDTLEDWNTALKGNLQIRSQSYQSLISSFLQFTLLSFAILKHRQYFLMLQTLNLNNKNLHLTKKKVW